MAHGQERIPGMKDLELLEAMNKAGLLKDPRMFAMQKAYRALPRVNLLQDALKRASAGRSL